MYPDQEDVRKYADLIGAKRGLQVFDGGVVWTLAHPAAPFTLRQTHYWGDNEVAQIKRAIRWLNNLPWPTEDDPRVEHTGAYA